MPRASEIEDDMSDQAKMLIRFAMGTEDHVKTKAGTKSWNRARGARGMASRAKGMVVEAEREGAARAADAKERDEHAMKTHYMPAKQTACRPESKTIPHAASCSCTTQNAAR
eukprot:2323411-Prymnesium_polylepis.1